MIEFSDLPINYMKLYEKNFFSWNFFIKENSFIYRSLSNLSEQLLEYRNKVKFLS